MLNETLNKMQTDPVSIHDLNRPVITTGIAKRSSANASAEEVAKQRFQRMRRRLERSIFSGRTATGWVARIV